MAAVHDPAGGRKPETSGGVLSGRARVIDGDTIELSGGVRIRFHGIDAPERGQSCRDRGALWLCGGLATHALSKRIAGRAVACDEKDRDRYGRIVAVCRLGGEDLNAWMVSEGWALAYRRYSRAYVAEESSAKAARLGVWRGDFVAPWDWRRGERLPSASRDTPQGRAPCHRQRDNGAALPAVAGAVSRETSATTAACAFITFPETGTTSAPKSVSRGASGGSAPKPRHGRRAGEERDGEILMNGKGGGHTRGYPSAAPGKQNTGMPLAPATTVTR